METPETRYARTSDGVHIAYQVFGEGPRDIVIMNSANLSNVEVAWEWESLTGLMFRWFARRGRVALLDRRGTGLSDGVSADRPPTLEARMDDIRAVTDAAGFERAVLFGVEDSAAQCLLFAATYPKRTAGVITFGATSRGLWAPDAPWQWTHDQWREELERTEQGWGSLAFTRWLIARNFPAGVDDEPFLRAYARTMRHAMSPAAAVTCLEMWRDTDIRRVLPLIQAPTLVCHARDDPEEPIEGARYIATHIPGAILLELPGADHWLTTMFRHGEEHVDQFLTDLSDIEAEFDRVLATVLFTDIVDSTALSAAMGDRAWAERREQHDRVVRTNLARFHGREIKTTGDGFLATFDGPARAVRCAASIAEAVRSLGMEIRAGLHTGEVTYDDGDVAGIGVAIGARVQTLAAPGQVLVSQTVKDLVAGSGLGFEEAGEHELKGVPERWRLYRVVP